jgi:hypothetical protein
MGEAKSTTEVRIHLPRRGRPAIRLLGSLCKNDLDTLLGDNHGCDEILEATRLQAEGYGS